MYDPETGYVGTVSAEYVRQAVGGQEPEETKFRGKETITDNDEAEVSNPELQEVGQTSN